MTSLIINYSKLVIRLEKGFNQKSPFIFYFKNDCIYYLNI